MKGRIQDKGSRNLESKALFIRRGFLPVLTYQDSRHADHSQLEISSTTYSISFLRANLLWKKWRGLNIGIASLRDDIALSHCSSGTGPPLLMKTHRHQAAIPPWLRELLNMYCLPSLQLAPQFQAPVVKESTAYGSKRRCCEFSVDSIKLA